MLPDPLHPALVHFPIVFTVLLPVAVGAALWISRRKPGRTGWLVSVLAAALLAGSAWVAVETGEAQEETVEAVVAESALHGHEEAAERFLLLSVGVLGLAGLGLLGGRAGGVARVATLAGSLVLVAAGYRVGRSGGELVYRHGAASAYADATAPAPGGELPRSEARRRQGERERDRDDGDERSDP